MVQLPIPEDISLEHEFLPGVTKKEMRWLLAAALPGVAAAVALWVTLADPGSQLMAMAVGIFYVIGCYGFFARIDGQQSIFSFLAKLIRFQKSQQIFYYREGKEGIYYVCKEKE